MNFNCGGRIFAKIFKNNTADCYFLNLLPHSPISPDQRRTLNNYSGDTPYIFCAVSVQ